MNTIENSIIPSSILNNAMWVWGCRTIRRLPTYEWMTVVLTHHKFKFNCSNSCDLNDNRMFRSYAWRVQYVQRACVACANTRHISQLNKSFLPFYHPLWVGHYYLITYYAFINRNRCERGQSVTIFNAFSFNSVPNHEHTHTHTRFACLRNLWCVCVSSTWSHRQIRPNER